MNTHINASIEASAKHVHDNKLERGMLPVGTRVYITDVGVDPVDDLIEAARKVTDMGYSVVPHIPARRIEGLDSLRSRLSGMVNDGGVTDILVIAGEADEQMGPYSSSLEILQTGLVDELGIRHVGIGGHPEGNPAYGNDDLMTVLKDKVAFGDRMDAEMRIVTQFGFDGAKFVNWANSVAAEDITLPIHLGVAGPAKITTLIKYAAMCGVGNSLNFLKKRSSSVFALATKHSPEEVVEPIEQAWLGDPTCNIEQLHVFPFGGLQSSAEWLDERGSLAFGGPKLALA